MPPTAFCSPSPDAFLSADRHLGVSAVVKVPLRCIICLLYTRECTRAERLDIIIHLP